MHIVSRVALGEKEVQVSTALRKGRVNDPRPRQCAKVSWLALFHNVALAESYL